MEGETLSYDRGENLVIIKGTVARPCRVDGAQVPKIELNLETGKIKTRLGTRPGSIMPPRREEN